MVGFATVIMSGQISRDPELRYSPNGVACVNFCVAVHRQNGLGKSTAYVECVRSGDGAEDVAAEYKQGDAVRIEGSLVQRRWQHGGKEHYGKLVVDAAILERT